MESENQISDKIILLTDSVQEMNGNEIRTRLITLINELIIKDFQALLHLLYRIDVDEKKIRRCLNINAREDSASILTDLIIERQLQKIAFRKNFGVKDHPQDDEEKW